ncbi:uncharacterized protein LOC135694929 isoform X2 [Rhopilema esculentum]
MEIAAFILSDLPEGIGSSVRQEKGISCLAEMMLFGSLASKKKKCRKEGKISGMSLLHLNESCLQNIVRLLDISSFLAISKTCKRLYEVTKYYSSWNSQVMLKKVEAIIYKAVETRDAIVIQLMYETCLNAEKLQLNLETICEANIAKLWNSMGAIAVEMFSLLNKINIDETVEVWPFCHVSMKELQFTLTDGSHIKVSYKSLLDKQSSFNNHIKVKITVTRHGIKHMILLYDSNPRGFLDSGMLPIKTSRTSIEDAIDLCGEQNPEVLRPAFQLFEKELSHCDCEITFDFFVKFIQNMEKGFEVDIAQYNLQTLGQNCQTLQDALEKARKSRQRLNIEYFQTERKRHEILNRENNCDGFIYCLGKLASMGGRYLKNTRLRVQCIRDVFQMQQPRSQKSREDLKLLPNVISNFDFDSITQGWACINPNLFTIWKDFTIKLGNGRNFKATISWEEKRDRLNEYSVANNEICLILHRKTLTVKSKMANPMDVSERTRSIKNLKKAMKKIISRVRLRKTGLNEISSTFLFSILMTILND